MVVTCLTNLLSSFVMEIFLSKQAAAENRLELRGERLFKPLKGVPLAQQSRRNLSDFEAEKTLVETG